MFENETIEISHHGSYRMAQRLGIAPGLQEKELAKASKRWVEVEKSDAKGKYLKRLKKIEAKSLNESRAVRCYEDCVYIIGNDGGHLAVVTALSKACIVHSERTRPFVRFKKATSIFESGPICLGKNMVFSAVSKDPKSPAVLQKALGKKALIVVVKGDFSGHPVSIVATNAFSKCAQKAVAVVLPDSVYSIPKCAFAEKQKLRFVKLPKSLRYVSDLSFLGCKSLRRIKIPYGVKGIGTAAFKNCSKLKSVSIPPNVSTIGPKAFQNCHSLKRMRFSNKVSFLGGKQFDGCEKLKKVVFHGTIKEWKYISRGRDLIPAACKVKCLDGVFLTKSQE